MVDGSSDLVQWVGVGMGLAISQRRGVGERDGGWWASPVRSVAAAVVEGGGGRGCWPCWGREKRMKKREEKILGGKNKLYTLLTLQDFFFFFF
jgi:hypothetical protein